MAVTRWREDSTLDPFGMFFYIRNVDAGSLWSATYAPLNILPEKYEVVFTADKAAFKRIDGEVETKTEVIAATGDNAEIRRISLKNTGESACVLEITSYLETVLARQADDVSHPAFSNLFMETSFLAGRNCLVSHRRPRSESEKCLWAANAIVVDGDLEGEIRFETDRMALIGRGRNATAPIAIQKGNALSNTAGPILDPVMCLQARVKVRQGETAQISYVVVASDDHELMLSLVDKYSDPESVEKAFQLALIRSRVETGYLNLEASEMELYQDMIRDILFISPTRLAYRDQIALNWKGQSSLWRYGISGDVPIVFVVLRSVDETKILEDVLNAHEYWRLMGLRVDLVLLCEEEYSYLLPLNSLVTDIVASHQSHDNTETPRDIFILDKNKVPVDDIHLLHATSRIVLIGDGTTMAEQTDIQPNRLPPGIRQFKPEPGTDEQPPSKEQTLLYPNGLGGFSPDGSEYVIKLEHGQHTPVPWVNVIANPSFGFLVSEAGSGYTWGVNSHEAKVTPWSNDIVCDSPGEALYIADTDTGEVWTPTALPIREAGPYAIRHGFGYTVFEHISHGIGQSMTQFVPLNESLKITLVNLKNISDRPRNLTLTSYIRPVLGVSDQDTAMHIQTSMNQSGVLLIENRYNEDFTDKLCFLDASVRDRSVIGDRKEFFGNGSSASPDCLNRERLSGSLGAGFDPCAAVQVSIALKPGEETDIVFLLGIGSKIADVEVLTNKYRNPTNARVALEAVKKFWKEKLEIVQVDTPAIPANLMLNGWLEYQVISCRLWARSGFYQSGGAFGFRDQLQDILAIAHLWPEAARAQILLHARHQFAEGDVLHWWHEPQGKGTRTRSSDDMLWLPFVTAEYIRITGDTGILKEEAPFLEGPILMEFEDECYLTPTVSKKSFPLYDHCIRAMDRALRFGVHSLPLMGSGDWNDSMNTVGNNGRGESVWLGWFIISILGKFLPLCRLSEDDKNESRYSELIGKITGAMEQFAWDGSWYRRAYFDNGMPLGSMVDSECKIDSLAQSWAVLSGAGDAQRAAQAMDSLNEHLISREDGLIKLLAPPFDMGDLEPGYIKGYLPGVRENGGQYTHAAAWVVIAFAEMGDGDRAWELFDLLNPVNHTRNSIEVARYKTEPYVMTADVYSAYPHVGRGGWSWYTGSAGWMYKAGLETILGFKKNGKTLVMDPCIPKKWREYSIKYRYGDTTYRIKVMNPDGINKGVRMITVDGAPAEGNVIDLADDGKSHDVNVVMGAKGE